MLDAILPERVEIQSEHFIVDGRYGQTLYVISLAPHVRLDQWRSLQDLEIEMDMSLFITPLQTLDVIKRLKTTLMRDETRLNELAKKGLPEDFVLRERWNTTSKACEMLERSEATMHSISIIVTLWGDSLDELNQNRKMFVAATQFAELKVATSQMVDGLRSNLPLGTNDLANAYSQRTMMSPTLKAFYPFR